MRSSWRRHVLLLVGVIAAIIRVEDGARRLVLELGLPGVVAEVRHWPKGLRLFPSFLKTDATAGRSPRPSVWVPLHATMARFRRGLRFACAALEQFVALLKTAPGCPRGSWPEDDSSLGFWGGVLVSMQAVRSKKIRRKKRATPQS